MDTSQFLHILPSQLQGDSEYTNLEHHYFCWRWINKNDETQYRFITLEATAPDAKFNYLNLKIYPTNLAGVNDYEQELNSKSRFSWKYITRNNETFRLLVIVDTNTPTDVGTNGLICPLSFVGTNDYAKSLQNHHRFCWRWVRCESGAQYRGVTIE